MRTNTRPSRRESSPLLDASRVADRQEIGGGYLWSPKRNANGSRNQFYENMKEVAPGDVVFSYWETAIRAFGQVRSFGYDAPKPDEFGAAGRNWSRIGYRVDVEYLRLVTPVRPR